MIIHVANGLCHTFEAFRKGCPNHGGKYCPNSPKVAAIASQWWLYSDAPPSPAWDGVLNAIHSLSIGLL